MGDHVVCGQQAARIRQLFVLDEGEEPRSVSEATAGQPVRIVGFSDSISSGERVLTATSEEHAETVVEARRNEEMAKSSGSSGKTCAGGETETSCEVR